MSPSVKALGQRLDLWIFWVDSENEDLSPEQGILLVQCLRDVKDGVVRLSSEHKDVHGSISKIGRAIDKVSADPPVLMVWLSSRRQGCACIDFFLDTWWRHTLFHYCLVCTRSSCRCVAWCKYLVDCWCFSVSSPNVYGRYQRQQSLLLVNNRHVIYHVMWAHVEGHLHQGVMMNVPELTWVILGNILHCICHTRSEMHKDCSGCVRGF